MYGEATLELFGNAVQTSFNKVRRQKLRVETFSVLELCTLKAHLYMEYGKLKMNIYIGTIFNWSCVC